MESHLHSNFIDSMDTLGTQVIQIPVGFSFLSQPCYVGIIKQIEIRLVEFRQGWKEAEYKRVDGSGRIPVPEGMQVLQWLYKVWREFQNGVILNSFENVDRSMISILTLTFL